VAEHSRVQVFVASAVIIALFLLFLYWYRPFISPLSVESAEAMLEAAGYEPCGVYTVKPGGFTINFTKEFNRPVKCYLIIKRPGENYILIDPRIIVLFEPGDRVTPYYYSVGIRWLSWVRAIKADPMLQPEINVGRYEPGRVIPAAPELRMANEDAFAVFSYMPENDRGFPVRITVKVYGEVKEGVASFPTEARRTTTTLVEPRTIITSVDDLKNFMARSGYELCGELRAEDRKELQTISVDIDVDLNKGRACYILIHPPNDKTGFLIVGWNDTLTIVGDKVQENEYNRKTGGKIVGSGFNIFGIGRGWTLPDVTPPFTEELGLSRGASGSNWRAGNAVLIYYFSAKGVPDFGEPLRFSLRVHFEIAFYVFPEG